MIDSFARLGHFQQQLVGLLAGQQIVFRQAHRYLSTGWGMGHGLSNLYGSAALYEKTVDMK